MVRHHCRIILGAGGDTNFFLYLVPLPLPSVSLFLIHLIPPFPVSSSLPSPPLWPSPPHLFLLPPRPPPLLLSRAAHGSRPCLSSRAARDADATARGAAQRGGGGEQRPAACSAARSGGEERCGAAQCVAAQRSGGGKQRRRRAAASSGRPRAARCGAGARSGAPSRCRGTPLP